MSNVNKENIKDVQMSNQSGQIKKSLIGVQVTKSISIFV